MEKIMVWGGPPVILYIYIYILYSRTRQTTVLIDFVGSKIFDPEPNEEKHY